MTRFSSADTAMEAVYESLALISPLLYDASGIPLDDETSYGWACLKYARDITPAAPEETYYSRARDNFRARWLVAPRWRSQSPSASRFWPRKGRSILPLQMPDLCPKEFLRQSEHMLRLSRDWIRKTQIDMERDAHRNDEPSLHLPNDHNRLDYGNAYESSPPRLPSINGVKEGPGVTLPPLRLVLSYRNL